MTVEELIESLEEYGGHLKVKVAACDAAKTGDVKFYEVDFVETDDILDPEETVLVIHTRPLERGI